MVVARLCVLHVHPCHDAHPTPTAEDLCHRAINLFILQIELTTWHWISVHLSNNSNDPTVGEEELTNVLNDYDNTPYYLWKR